MYEYFRNYNFHENSLKENLDALEHSDGYGVTPFKIYEEGLVTIWGSALFTKAVTNDYGYNKTLVNFELRVDLIVNSEQLISAVTRTNEVTYNLFIKNNEHTEKIARSIIEEEIDNQYFLAINYNPKDIERIQSIHYGWNNEFKLYIMSQLLKLNK